MKSYKISILMSIVSMLVFTIGTAWADQSIVLVSNLTNSDSPSGDVNLNSYTGVQFTTGNDFYNLVDITLEMNLSIASGGFFVQLWNSGNPTVDIPNGQPTTVMETLTGNTNPTSAGQYTYTSSGVTLAPNTDYWVVAGSTVYDPNGFWWGFAPDSNSIGEPETQMGRNIWSLDQGNSWVDGNINDYYGPHEIAVSATVIPEPSSAVLITIIGGFGLFVRRHFPSV